MQRVTVDLDDEQLRALERVAAEDRQSVPDVLRRAIDSYLRQRLVDGRGREERFDALVARVRARMPADVTPEEIEATMGAARADYRAGRAAARAPDAAPVDAGGG